jgi:DNA-binding NarL/FixJ family response regulator
VTKGTATATQPLTTRQRQVVQLLADGASCPKIAARLGISVRTVHAHVRVIAALLTGKQPPIRRIVANADKLLAA